MRPRDTRSVRRELNRENAAALAPRLEHDPTSDPPEGRETHWVDSTPDHDRRTLSILMPIVSNLVGRLARTPRTLFFMDGVGALVTALLVGVVLPTLREYIAMPRPVLRALALTALLLAVYSMACVVLRPARWPRYLRGIALANAMYCVVTAGCLLYLRTHLAMGDWIYFVGEIVVVAGLVALEHGVAAAATTTDRALTAHRAADRR